MPLTMGTDDTHPIEDCPQCGQKNRIRPHSLRYKPVCAICRTDLPDPFRIGEEIWLHEDDMPMQRLSFELLPPGSWDIDDVIAHYQREESNLPAYLRGGTIEWQRLIRIKSLKPTKCYIGTELWLGYVLFEFSYSGKVVLECPIEGNATYIISGNWKPMLRHTKKYLREHYPNRYAKVVHKGAWLDRIREAL